MTLNQQHFIDCPDCNGQGVVAVPIGFCSGDPRVDDWDEDECVTCGGTGKIEAEDWEDD
jgi:DnaJ-class molecular chaperone